MRVDDALIDRVFQPLADWMNRTMALGTNRAARTAVDLASLAWICAEAGAAAHAVASQDLRSTVVRGAVIVLGLFALTILRGVFQRTEGTAGAHVQANPLRLGMRTHRAACLLWTIALAVKTIAAPSGSLALLAVGLFATVAVYIGACTNRPPAWRESRSRVSGRDWAQASARV